MSRFGYDALYEAEPSKVLDVLTTRDFLDEYAKSLRATDWQVRVEPDGGDRSAVTEMVLEAPTYALPSMFRRFVGATVAITETRRWDLGTPQTYAAEWTVHAVLGGRDAYVRGDLTLRPHGDGARFDASAGVQVRLGPLSGAAAGRVGQLMVAALGEQTALVNQWLERPTTG